MRTLLESIRSLPLSQLVVAAGILIASSSAAFYSGKATSARPANSTLQLLPLDIGSGSENMLALIPTAELCAEALQRPEQQQKDCAMARATDAPYIGYALNQHDDDRTPGAAVRQLAARR